MPDHIFYIGAGVVFVIGLIVYAVLKYEKDRRQGLKDFALGAGFTYSREYSPEGEFEGFGIFHKGHARKSSNSLSGSRGGVYYNIFDYRYRVGGGNSSHTYNQTIASARLSRANLPAFTLAPKTFFHRIGEKFGMQDINFEHYPEFSNFYLLRGEDEAAIRETFKTYILDYFQNRKPKVTVEARDNRLLYYKLGKRAKPANLTVFFDEFRQIVALFDRGG